MVSSYNFTFNDIALIIESRECDTADVNLEYAAEKAVIVQRIVVMSTAWKVSKYRLISGPYSVRILEKTDQK